MQPTILSQALTQQSLVEIRKNQPIKIVKGLNAPAPLVWETPTSLKTKSAYLKVLPAICALAGAVFLGSVVLAGVIGPFAIPIAGAAIAVFAISLVAFVILKINYSRESLLHLSQVPSKLDLDSLTDFIEGRVDFESLTPKQRQLLITLGDQIVEIREAEKNGFNGIPLEMRNLLRACAQSQMPFFKLRESLFDFYKFIVTSPATGTIHDYVANLNRGTGSHTAGATAQGDYDKDIPRHQGVLIIGDEIINLANLGPRVDATKAMISEELGKLPAFQENPGDRVIDDIVKLFLTQAAYGAPLPGMVSMMANSGSEPAFRLGDRTLITEITSQTKNRLEISHRFTFKVEKRNEEDCPLIGTVTYDFIFGLEKRGGKWELTYHQSSTPLFVPALGDADPACFDSAGIEWQTHSLN